jgi:hypothetical protein
MKVMNNSANAKAEPRRIKPRGRSSAKRLQQDSIVANSLAIVFTRPFRKDQAVRIDVKRIENRKL